MGKKIIFECDCGYSYAAGWLESKVWPPDRIAFEMHQIWHNRPRKADA